MTSSESVIIRCQDHAAVGVTFRDRFSFDADSVHYAVELRAPGLNARVDEVVSWIWDSDLAPFLEGLAAAGTVNGAGAHRRCRPDGGGRLPVRRVRRADLNPVRHPPVPPRGAVIDWAA
ncbi:DUF6228 family protein [Streptomyces niveus]